MNEKVGLARFLALAGDYLRDGYAKSRPPLIFEEESPPRAGPSPEDLAGDIRRCRRCPLHAGRTQAVPGEGVSRPLALIVGEGPGAEEDASGRPFVGPAGRLLDRMLASIGLFRDKNCFIANAVKCRPPGNRDPLPEESAACLPFLEAQIRLLRPRVILSVGRVATGLLLKTGEAIGRLRGRFAEYRLPGAGEAPVPLLPTYHPSALLRDESLKRPAWEDLKTLRTRLAELDPGYARENAPGPG